MLTPVYTRRIVIFSSLFAAVCAGYIAGQRSLFFTGPMRATAAHPEREPLPNPATIMPHSTGGGVTVAFLPDESIVPSPDPRLGALLDMSEIKAWNLLFLPDPAATRLQIRLELRESGKPTVLVADSCFGVNSSKEQKGNPQRLNISFMPISGTLSTAEKIRARIAVAGLASTQEAPNPLHHYSSMGTLSSDEALGTTTEKIAEMPLMQATFGQYGETTRKRVLYITFRAQYN